MWLLCESLLGKKTSYTYLIGYGPFVFDFASLDTDRVKVVPGAWQALGYDVTVAAGGESWLYEFSGSRPLTVAPGQTVPVDLGGPLTAVAEATPPTGLVNSTVILRGVALDQNGFGLTGTWVYDAASGEFLRPVLNQMSITGPGYRLTNLLYDGDKARWMAPAAAGTYSLHFSRQELGPYGGLMPTADGTVKVIRLVR